jgi:hypothetical protein
MNKHIVKHIATPIERQRPFELQLQVQGFKRQPFWHPVKEAANNRSDLERNKFKMTTCHCQGVNRLHSGSTCHKKMQFAFTISRDKKSRKHWLDLKTFRRGDAQRHGTGSQYRTRAEAGNCLSRNGTVPVPETYSAFTGASSRIAKSTNRPRASTSHTVSVPYCCITHLPVPSHPEANMFRQMNTTTRLDLKSLSQGLFRIHPCAAGLL